jgi:hypothetical protein
MADDEITLVEIYAEVDKRVKAAVDAAVAELKAELDKRAPVKKPFSIKRA